MPTRGFTNSGGAGKKRANQGYIGGGTPQGYSGLLNFTGGNQSIGSAPASQYAMTPSQLAAALGIPQSARGPAASVQQATAPQAAPTTGARSRGAAPGAPTVSGPMGPQASVQTASAPPSQAAPIPTFGMAGIPNATPQGSLVTTAATGTPTTGGTGGMGTATNLPQNPSDPTDWTFQGSDTVFSQRDLETLMNDPYRFQQEFLKSRGMDTPGANAALGQFGSRINPLAFVYAGQNMSPEGQSDLEDLANVYEGLFSNYITPGGRMPDVAEIMNVLTSTPNIESGGTATNLLQKVLAGQDPEGQAQAVNQILGAALAGMPGLFGQGWAGMLDDSANRYLNSTMDAYGGPTATYLDYMRNDPFFSRLATGR